jgi:hypothetical protein
LQGDGNINLRTHHGEQDDLGKHPDLAQLG